MAENIRSIIKTEISEFNCDKLKAKESKEKNVTSGYQTYIDLERMNLAINGIKIDQSLVKNLLNKAENDPDSKKLKNVIDTINALPSHLKEGEGDPLYYYNKQYYHSILTEVFAKIFQCAGVKIPDEHLISELIVNLNQAGYYGTLYHNVFQPSAVKCNLIPHSSKQMIHINCDSSNEIKFKIDEKMDISRPDCGDPKEEVLASLSSSVMFTLQSDRDNNVSYMGGKLSDIIIQVSEKLDLEKNESLFSKFIEWIKTFMENNFGIKTDKVSVKITKLDKPNSKIEDGTVQHYKQESVSYVLGS